jgi:hypothetical protein
MWSSTTGGSGTGNGGWSQAKAAAAAKAYGMEQAWSGDPDVPPPPPAPTGGWVAPGMNAMSGPPPPVSGKAAAPPPPPPPQPTTPMPATTAAALGIPPPMSKAAQKTEFLQAVDWVLDAAAEMPAKREAAKTAAELAAKSSAAAAAAAKALAALATNPQGPDGGKPTHQAAKRARRRQADAEVKALAELKAARVASASSASASSSSSGAVWNVVVESVVEGIDAMKLIAEEAMSVDDDGGSEVKGKKGQGGGSSMVSTAATTTDTFRGSSAGGALAGVVVDAGDGGDVVGRDGDAASTEYVGGSEAFIESSSEEEGDGDATNPRPMKGKLACAECAADCEHRSQFLLSDGGPGGCSASWQRKMWGHCLACSGMTAKEFKKHAKRKWSQRANALRERVQTVRCADFDTVAATIARSMPGASRRVVRELACSCIRVATISFAESIRTEDPVLLECRDMLTVQHLADLERAAADPRHACIVEGRFLAAQELQYLTSVAQGITVSFCCRSRKCLWFGLNHEWSKH